MKFSGGAWKLVLAFFFALGAMANFGYNTLRMDMGLIIVAILIIWCFLTKQQRKEAFEAEVQRQIKIQQEQASQISKDAESAPQKTTTQARPTKYEDAPQAVNNTHEEQKVDSQAFMERQCETTSPHAETKKRNRQYKFLAVGLNYRKDTLEELLIENDYYTAPMREVAEAYGAGERIYKYEITIMDVDLIPEPDNLDDANAIMITVGGEKVGYVAKEETAAVRKFLDSPELNVSLEVYGGPYKELDEDEDGRLHSTRRSSNYAGALTITVS